MMHLITRHFPLSHLLLCCMLELGVVESRWAFLSSKLVAGCYAVRGGFDSHPFPAYEFFENKVSGELWMNQPLRRFAGT